MVGQKDLIQVIDTQITKQQFPRFCILVGSKGSQKAEMAKHIAKQLNALYVPVIDCKADSIKEVINNAYRVNSVTLYDIQDADMMSLQSKNAMLKVTEEPPNKAYFLMSLESLDNTLATIQSRGTAYFMQHYSSEELIEYSKKYNYDEDELKIVISICNNPGDIDLLHTYNPKEFYNFVEKVIGHIATSSGSNALKIAQNIKFKTTDTEGYDLSLFWKTVCVICAEYKYYKGLSLTSNYLALSSFKSINKSMLFDRWILDVRKEWANGSC
jgi:ATP-dependent protease HslVU (ClpYQ) ATPase subunit